MTSWGRFQRKFDNIIENLKRHEDLIDKEVNAHDIAEARQLRKEIEVWKSESLEKLQKEEKEQKARHHQGLTSWLRLDDSDQIMIHDSLTKIGTIYPGTVGWVLKKPEVAAWLQTSPSASLLWLRGGPGTGKSVITARLVAFLETSGKSLVLRHFCSYSQASSTLYDQIIKALLMQCIQNDTELATHIYEEHVGSKQCTLPLLEKLLETAIEALSGGSWDQKTVHILLDGLDECPEDKQRRLIRLLTRLATNENNCKVLISSRDIISSGGSLKRSVVLALSEEKECLHAAIERFAQMRLHAIHDKLVELGISEDDIQEISSRIAAKSDGSFWFLASYTQEPLN